MCIGEFLEKNEPNQIPAAFDIIEILITSLANENQSAVARATLL